MYVICCQGLQPRAILETSGTVFPNADLPRSTNDIFIFFYGIVVKGPKMSKILVKKIKLTFAMIALIIGIHKNHALSKK